MWTQSAQAEFQSQNGVQASTEIATADCTLGYACQQLPDQAANLHKSKSIYKKADKTDKMMCSRCMAISTLDMLSNLRTLEGKGHSGVKFHSTEAKVSM